MMENENSDSDDSSDDDDADGGDDVDLKASILSAKGTASHESAGKPASSFNMQLTRPSTKPRPMIQELN